MAAGSNLDPARHLTQALSALSRLPALRITALSRVWASTPRDARGRVDPSQPAFRNAVWRGLTDLPSRELKSGVLRGLEQAAGRVRTQDRYAARCLDLDLIWYADQALGEADLRRPFVAVPLLELAPDLVLPRTGEPLAGLAAARPSPDMAVDDELTDTLRRLLDAG